ncbi:MAG: radical SAM family heme chaperone HemW [Bacteroidia bacterium]|nr:radical SAM family heme chaperone HemW [Bacteroidia bacterium]
MSSVYIHIPYCHHKCTYCDFHFSVQKRSLNTILDAIIKEIDDRREYLDSKKLESIYFGGGTPSILSIKQLETIFKQLSSIYNWDKNAEITIECNPEDLNKEYVQGLKELGFNRISLGIQSLNDTVLQWMGRHHTVEQSLKSIELLQKMKIDNFSIDLIFGLPFYDSEYLLKDLKYLVNKFHPRHISAYQLTIEPKTKLHHLVQKKNLIPASDEKVAKEFLLIQEYLTKNGYIHYEVSNYAQEGFYSKHNSAYWLQKKYIGIGPSAHSYNGKERRWNIANNYIYAKNVLSGKTYSDKEDLSTKQLYNEYVYTRLRTIYGCDLKEIEHFFGKKLKEDFLRNYENYKEYFIVNNQNYCLIPNKGYLIADKIAVDFFV